jgi:transposase
MDAKAVIKLGEFSRGGTSRVPVRALDHDYPGEGRITPYGIFLPNLDELFLYLATSKVTSDFIVDTLSAWWTKVRRRFRSVDTLVLLLDNGPENHSRRTQFLKRIVDFVRQTRVRIRLAYYPPYCSKYNPVERCWGILEKHWNGSLLDSVDAVVGYAQSMTWKGRHPWVELRLREYETGIRLSKAAMTAIEEHVVRLPGLEPWFLDVPVPR